MTHGKASRYSVCDRLWVMKMPLINCSFQKFVSRIHKTGKSIICYGAGMMPLYIEPLFGQYNLLQKVCLFIDSNARKKGKKLFYGNRNIPVEAPEYLKKVNKAHYVILITAEKYKEIARTLGDVISLEEWECYAYPLLNLSYFKSMGKRNIFIKEHSTISKTIHYTWFGSNDKQRLHEKCINSWRCLCPDYEIREWNETNYDVHKNQYMEQAYEKKKWAYVSDYARLDILYQYGGVYFDTDVELIKNIDPLLNTEAFLCFGEWPAPNSGAGIGCAKGNKIIKEIMETRETISFIQQDGSGDMHTNSNYELQVLIRHGFHMDFEFQIKDGMALYPPDIIAPASITGKDSFVTERTFGVHYCNNSWRV